MYFVCACYQYCEDLQIKIMFYKWCSKKFILRRVPHKYIKHNIRYVAMEPGSNARPSTRAPQLKRPQYKTRSIDKNGRT